MKRWKWGNSDYDAFPSQDFQVAFWNIVAQSILKSVYPWPLIVPVRDRFASFTDAH